MTCLNQHNAVRRYNIKRNFCVFLFSGFSGTSKEICTRSAAFQRILDVSNCVALRRKNESLCKGSQLTIPRVVMLFMFWFYVSGCLFFFSVPSYTPIWLCLSALDVNTNSVFFANRISIHLTITKKFERTEILQMLLLTLLGGKKNCKVLPNGLLKSRAVLP